MATATRNTSGTDTDTSKALTSFGVSFATVSTANSSSASSSSSSRTTSFADEASHADTATRRVSFQTAFFADSSSSLSLDDIAEADDEADHSPRTHHTKEDLQAGSSSLPPASLNEASADAEEDALGEEQRQAKRRTPFLKPRKKELHYFVIAAEMEAELDDSDSDSDDDFDDDSDKVFGR